MTRKTPATTANEIGELLALALQECLNSTDQPADTQRQSSETEVRT